VPSFVEQLQNGTISLNQSETLYTLWIGTNDVYVHCPQAVTCNLTIFFRGSKTLLSGGVAPGVSIVEVTECAVNWVKTLYDLGARNFLFQSVRIRLCILPFIPLPNFSHSAFP